MMLIVGHVLDCLLMMQVILFPELDITLLSYFQAIMVLELLSAKANLRDFSLDQSF